MSSLFSFPASLMRASPPQQAAQCPVRITPGSTGVMVGDSITSTAYTFFAGMQTNCNTVFTTAGKPLATFINSGVSGAGLLDNLSLSFWSGTNYITYVTQFNPSWMNLFVGVNDVVSSGVWDATVFQSRMLTFLQNCLAGAPNLTPNQINICTPWVFGDPTGPNDAQMDQGTVAARAVAQTLGCSLVDWRTDRPTDGGYTDDGKHPSTPKGKNYLAGRLQRAFAFAIN